MVNWEMEADWASDSVCLRLCTTVQVVVGGILAAQHILILSRVLHAAEVPAEGRASLLATSSSMHKEFTRETGNLSLPRSAIRHHLRARRHRHRRHRIRR